MSFPISYAQPESLAIPTQLVGDELKSFKGAKTVIKSVSSTSGGNVGPSSTIQFSIPTGGYSFIKPNSMYLRLQVTVTIAGGAGVAWKFAGNSNADAAENVPVYDFGGASSLISRVNVNFGGTVMTYNNYNHFRNAVLPHCLNSQYFQTDLRQLEYNGVYKQATTNDDRNKIVNVAIPLWIPAFNAQQAFPSLLMKSPITIEFLTETVNAAFYAVGASVTNYQLANMYLVYEEIQVSPEFKSALLTSKAGQNYNISINDFWSIGPTAATAGMTYQIGCQLSSLKSVLFTEQLTDDSSATLSKKKKYLNNGLINYTIYVDGQVVTPPNLTDDAYCYAEMNRALQRINDSTLSSYIEPATNTDLTCRRNYFNDTNFLAGTSTMVISDYGYSSCGIPASMVTLELNHGTQTVDKWQVVQNFASANLYAFLLHDSILSVDVSQGMVSIRK